MAVQVPRRATETVWPVQNWAAERISGRNFQDRVLALQRCAHLKASGPLKGKVKMHVAAPAELFKVHRGAQKRETPERGGVGKMQHPPTSIMQFARKRASAATARSNRKHLVLTASRLCIPMAEIALLALSRAALGGTC